MHIPDGFVDIPVAIATGAVSAGVVAYSIRRTGKNLGERTVPLLGVTAAFVFAAQMLNFPVAGGTSGHFLGAVLAAVLMGPWAATLVMTVVLLVQALAMADGGVTALGANVLNMAVVAVFAGYGLFLLLKRFLPRSPAGYLVATSVAAWVSVVLAAAACAVELAVSGTVPLRLALAGMSSVHMIIAIGEALITTTVVGAVLASRPDLVKTFDLPLETVRGALREAGASATTTRPVAKARRGRFWAFAAGALVVAAALAVFISPFASGSPDGLERVAEDHGFASAATQEPLWRFSPLFDYQMPGIENERIATSVAGLIGVVVLFILILALGRAFGRRGAPPASRPAVDHEPPASNG